MKPFLARETISFTPSMNPDDQTMPAAPAPADVPMMPAKPAMAPEGESASPEGESMPAMPMPAEEEPMAPEEPAA